MDEPSRVIMSSKTSYTGLLVWFVCVLFYLYEFLLRTLLGTFQPAIMNELQLSSFDFALLSSTAYLFVYGLMQIPVGMILAKFGIKKSMLVAAIICTVATLGFSYSYNYYTAFLFRSLMGLGSSFGFICVLVAVYDWMPYKNIALYIGLSQFMGTMGPMAAGGPLNALAQASIITWRHLFSILSFIGLILILLIALFVKNNKKTDEAFVILKRPPNLKQNMLAMMRDRQVWVIAIYCAFLYFGLEYLSENECKNLLLTKGFSSGFSSYMITIAWLGFAVGSPIFGYLSDKINRRKPILFFSAISALLSLTCIIYLPVPQLGIIISFFTFGIGVGSASVGIVLMGEQFQSDKRSSGLGLNNAISILFVSLMAPCISYLLTFIANGSSYLCTGQFL